MMTTSPFIDELQRMPTDQLEETAECIHSFIEERRERRAQMIDATSGSLSGEEGEALETALA
jgi:hypothetical protein